MKNDLSLIKDSFSIFPGFMQVVAYQAFTELIHGNLGKMPAIISVCLEFTWIRKVLGTLIITWKKIITL